MLTTVVLWILGGSFLLWIMLTNVLLVAWVFSLVKRLVFPSNPVKANNKQEIC
jgi:hypothetical protein